MADEKSPLKARARLPFDVKADDRGRAMRMRLRAFLYLTVAVICGALAGYTHLVSFQPLVSTQVLVPAGGALYFLVRGVATFVGAR